MTKPLNIPMPNVSPNFTIEDIHKIREWNYERRKHMSVEDRCADVNHTAQKVQREIEELRRAQSAA